MLLCMILVTAEQRVEWAKTCMFVLLPEQSKFALNLDLGQTVPSSLLKHWSKK